MTPHDDAHQEIRQYLLGTLSQEAGQRVEERLMTDEDFLDELAVYEGELIDDYVGGRLSDGERAGFEQHFLSTEERLRQLRFTQALGRYASANAPAAENEEATAKAAASHEPARPAATTFGERLRAFWGGRSLAFRAGFALAAVAVIAGALWLARPTTPTAPRTFYALALAPGAGDRSGDTRPPGVKLPLGKDALRLTLALPEGTAPAARYRVELTSDKGRGEVLEASAQDARTVVVVVPESRLARGRYLLRLTAVGDAEQRAGTYLFDVE